MMHTALTRIGGDRSAYTIRDGVIHGPGGRTATIDQSLSANSLAPTFTSIRIETRGTPRQDGPPTRVAIHPDERLLQALRERQRAPAAPSCANASRSNIPSPTSVPGQAVELVPSAPARTASICVARRAGM